MSKVQNIFNELLTFFLIRFDKNFERLQKSIRKLSGGEQQKIRLLCSLLLNCSVLILDEPTSQIDKQSSMIIKDYLESEKKNRIIIIVTHDIKLANDFQDAKRLNLKLLRGEETC